MNEYRLNFEKARRASSAKNGYNVSLEEATIWHVWSGRVSYGDFVKEEIVFSDEDIANCYAWIKAKKEGLMLLK
jgi:hypothetical protein